MNPRAPSAIALSDCDREPIHILGTIQSFGYLMSVNADWLVVRASENIGGLVGKGHPEVLGRSLGTFLSATLLHDIRGRLQVAGGLGIDHLYTDELPEFNSA
jgi:light-regulated signal transduction histidine kinase (bacteriophytochrome)